MGIGPRKINGRVNEKNVNVLNILSFYFFKGKKILKRKKIQIIIIKNFGCAIFVSSPGIFNLKFLIGAKFKWIIQRLIFCRAKNLLALFTCNSHRVLINQSIFIYSNTFRRNRTPIGVYYHMCIDQRNRDEQILFRMRACNRSIIYEATVDALSPIKIRFWQYLL